MRFVVGTGRTCVVVATTAAVPVSAGAAAAAQRTPDEQIHACVDKTSGFARIVDGSRGCTNRERAVAWNKAGPEGLKGDRGPAGPKGNTGPAGPKGNTGGVSTPRSR